MQTHATKKFYLQQASNIHFQKTCFEINQFLLCVNKDEHAWVFFFFFCFGLGKETSNCCNFSKCEDDDPKPNSQVKFVPSYPSQLETKVCRLIKTFV